MAGKFLIDLTDARFHVAGNGDVLERWCAGFADVDIAA
jgi:hypothetical protein